MGIFSNMIKEKVEQQAMRDILEHTPRRDVNDERIAAAVEVITSHVMIADESNIIVGINSATLKMMQKAEKDIQKALPQFSADNLIGASIDAFHENPAHQKSMLKNLQTTHFGQISVGVRTFDLIANPILDKESTRIGTVVEWLDVTDKLAGEKLEHQRVEEEKVQAAANSRIRSALDVVASNVMMTDEKNNIVYANKSVLQMLTAAEADIRKELPNFTAKTVIGSNIDIFHKNPTHQIKILDALNSTYKTEIRVGVRTFALVANPVFDETGGRLGTVVEWSDRTNELAFEETINEAIEAAVQGNIEARLDAGDTQGFIAKVASGINTLLEIFENVIADASNSINALSNGQLDQKITTEYRGSFDVLKQNINNTIDKLVEVVTEIKGTAISVKDGSNEIASGNTNLSQRTEEQAASLEETSAAMEEITTTVQQTAANALQANTLAQEAKGSAENGGTVVNDAISAMQAISDSSDQIADIITVIDEIAFQTNLLALNAAVEAARAGDQGKGFAVVADEVRSLAGRSAKAAKEIKNLIKDSGEKVKEGSDLVNKSGKTLDEIVTAIKKVNDIVAEISTASDEQSTGLAEINRAVGEMDEMTQQNAALVEEASAAAEALGNQSVILDELISFFDTGIVAADSVQPAITTEKPVIPVARKKVVAADSVQPAITAKKPVIPVARKKVVAANSVQTKITAKKPGIPVARKKVVAANSVQTKITAKKPVIPVAKKKVVAADSVQPAITAKKPGIPVAKKPVIPVARKKVVAPKATDNVQEGEDWSEF